jgi:SAM-dependent methyltransferase
MKALLKTKLQPTGGLLIAQRQLRRELSIWLTHRRGVRAARELVSYEQVHVGSGDRLLPGWLNVDLDPAADLQLDLREPLPLRPQSVSRVFAEHFFEHLQYPHETAPFLAGVFEVLRPGGQLLLSVPDVGGLMREFNDEDSPRYADLAERRYGRTRVEQLNVIFRQENDEGPRRPKPTGPIEGGVLRPRCRGLMCGGRAARCGR